MIQGSSRRLPAMGWMGIGVAAGLLVAVSAVAFGGPAGLQLAARYTARLSFWWFLCAYLAGPLARLTRTGQTLTDMARAALINRRGLGLGFAMVHLIHLGALTAYVTAAHLHPKASTLAAGGVAYGLLGAMVATSHDAAQRRMGRWWRRLHLLGLHSLWLVFVLTLVADMQTGVDYGVRGVMIAAAVAALGLRGAAWLRGASRRPKPA